MDTQVRFGREIWIEIETSKSFSIDVIFKAMRPHELSKSSKTGEGEEALQGYGGEAETREEWPVRQEENQESEGSWTPRGRHVRCCLWAQGDED